MAPVCYYVLVEKNEIMPIRFRRFSVQLSVLPQAKDLLEEKEEGVQESVRFSVQLSVLPQAKDLLDSRRWDLTLYGHGDLISLCRERAI